MISPPPSRAATEPAAGGPPADAGLVAAPAIPGLAVAWHESARFIDLAPFVIGLLVHVRDEGAVAASPDDVRAWGRTTSAVCAGLVDAAPELTSEVLVDDGALLIHRVGADTRPLVAPAARGARLADDLAALGLGGERSALVVTSAQDVLVAPRGDAASVGALLDVAQRAFQQGTGVSPCVYTAAPQGLVPWLPGRGADTALRERLVAVQTWFRQVQVLGQQEFLLNGEGRAWMQEHELGLAEEPGDIPGGVVEVRASRFADHPGGVLIAHAPRVRFIDDVSPTVETAESDLASYLRDAGDVVDLVPSLRPPRYLVRRFPDAYEWGDMKRGAFIRALGQELS